MSDLEPGTSQPTSKEIPTGRVNLARISFNGEQIDRTQGALLKEAMGNRKSLLVVVHPFLYADYPPIRTDPQYPKRFGEYSQELSHILSRASERELPVVIFQPVSYSHADEKAIKKAEEKLKNQLESLNVTGNFFVVYTQEDAPSPIMEQEFYSGLWEDIDGYIRRSRIGQIVEEGKDYKKTPDMSILWGHSPVETNLPLASFVRSFQETSGAEKVIVTGSYVGGMMFENGDGFVGERKKPVRAEDSTNKYSIYTRSYHYRNQPDVTESIAKGDACVFKLANYLRRVGIKVGIGSATYPERFPRKTDVVKVTDTLWQDVFWIDTGSKTHGINFPDDMSNAEKAETILFIQEIREAVASSDFVVLSEEQSTRVGELERRHLLPDDLEQAFNKTDLIKI